MYRLAFSWRVQLDVRITKMNHANLLGLPRLFSSITEPCVRNKQFFSLSLPPEKAARAMQLYGGRGQPLQTASKKYPEIPPKKSPRKKKKKKKKEKDVS
jgi:hypothetical protein